MVLPAPRPAGKVLPDSPICFHIGSGVTGTTSIDSSEYRGRIARDPEVAPFFKGRDCRGCINVGDSKTSGSSYARSEGRGMEELLIDKISDFSENGLAQFYSQQACPDRTTQVLFKLFKDSGWQIGVPAK